ncbi:UNVERIFIED_CONTAM: NDR1/HIN1-like protein 6 [Sesamum calycinum]|uniref:NDR1/HIN1-like protein 6 n=1 Tax=Sesamum calycinum TaxID=2727403 RepID=A0AAW2SVT2_9LAMI
MADHQRIHPVQEPEVVEPERPHKPTAPLVERGSSRSENGDPERQYLPPFRRGIPYEPLKPPRRRSCCRKCLCWTLALVLVQLIILGILAAVVYFVFQPKIPKYSVDAMRITQFNLGNDNSLSATFNVNITARNPNKKIGIYYEGPPQHHPAQPDAGGANAGRCRAAAVVAGAAADRKHPAEPPGQSPGEAETLEVEADEMEVLGEVQAGG